MKADEQIERVEWSKPPDLPGTEVLLADHCAHLWRVFHETYTVCTLTDCPETIWRYRDKTQFNSTGDLMFMEPGELHVTKWIPRPASFRVVFIDFSVIEQAARELGMTASQPHLIASRVSDPMLFQAFACLHQSLESDATKLERQSRFTACIRLLLERCTEKAPPIPQRKPSRPALFQAMAFIHEYFQENIALDEIAAVTGLSRFHLARAFAVEFGAPPHAYQNNVRLTKARALISAGLPLAVVAADLGFADQSHFARAFKGAFGITPGGYARRTARVSGASMRVHL